MVSSLVFAAVLGGLDKLQPVDEGPSDKQFLEFRTNMIAAIKKKNYKYVNSRIDDEIHWSFGGDFGKESLLKYWNNDNKQEEFYDELLQVLQLGGVFNHYDDGSKTFSAPYSFTEWPDKYDAFEYVVAVKENVPVYIKPATDSTKVGTVSFDIMKVIYSDDYFEGWHQIMTPDNKRGWVQRGPVRSPISYRAGFLKQKGSWYMTRFIAGD